MICACLLLCLQTYKAEVLAFVRALPPAALAQLLRLPEPASLPRRRGPQTLQGSQQQQQSKPGKASSAAVEAASATAASIQRLQSSALSDAWLKASSCAAADGAAGCQAAGLPPVLSRLARLCCGLAPSLCHVDDAADEQLPLLRPESGPAAGKYAAAAPGHLDNRPGDPAAAALAAAHVVDLRGRCCSSCGSLAAGQHAAALMSCSCRCHPASSADAGQAAAALLPGFDVIIGLLEAASEGTWLCNPRLLQQQHTSGCSCSVCQGFISPAATTAASKGGSASSSRRENGAAVLPGAGPGAGWSPEAVMASISSGLDVLDVLGEWGVTDAALSYAVERRLVTAFHRVSRASAG